MPRPTFKTKVHDVMRTVSSGTDRWFSWLKGTAFRVIVLLLITTIQLWISVFLYGSFYYSYMPTVSHISPVYLQFSSCREYGMRASCPFPSVNVTLVNDIETGSLLMRGQKYKILLELDMPQSPVNEHLGVFMIKIDIYSASGEVTGSSSRPAMMHYRSDILKTIETLFFSPLFLIGYSEEKQILTVNLMENFVDNPYKPMVGVHVQLQARKLEIYSSVLKIHAYFSGLRYLMFYWPICTAMAFIGIFFILLCLITALSWQQCVRAFPSQQEPEVVQVEDVQSLSYAEQRKMLKQSMESERAALFRNYPQSITVINEEADEGILDDEEYQSFEMDSLDVTDPRVRPAMLNQTAAVQDVTSASRSSSSSSSSYSEVEKYKPNYSGAKKTGSYTTTSDKVLRSEPNKDREEVDGQESGMQEVDEKEVDEKEVDEKEVDEKEVDEEEVDEKEIDEKEIDEKEIDEKDVDEKDVDEKDVDEKEVEEIGEKVLEMETTVEELEHNKESENAMLVPEGEELRHRKKRDPDKTYV